MISGTSCRNATCRLKRLNWLCLGLVAIVGAVDAGALTLDGLLSRLALDEPDEVVRYRETRHSGLLTQPVVISGELRLSRNGDLRQRWEGDEGPVTVHVVGDEVTVERPQGTKRFALDQAGPLAPVVEALRAVVAGDARALRDDFRTRLSGDADRWTLTLSPRQRSSGVGVAGSPSEQRQSAKLTLRGGQRLQGLTLEDGERRIEIEILGSSK